MISTLEMGPVDIGAIVLFVMAVTYAFKVAGLNSRWLPLVSVFLAVVVALLVGGQNWFTVVGGVLLGFTTSGFYDFTKITIFGKE